jgi:hypothetical protein
LRTGCCNKTTSAKRFEPSLAPCISFPHSCTLQTPSPMLNPPPLTAPSLQAIDVEVNQGPGLPFKMVHVVLDYSQQQQKSYMGGFKNKRTGAVYHHVWTQTPRQPKYQVRTGGRQEGMGKGAQERWARRAAEGLRWHGGGAELARGVQGAHERHSLLDHCFASGGPSTCVGATGSGKVRDADLQHASSTHGLSPHAGLLCCRMPRGSSSA